METREWQAAENDEAKLNRVTIVMTRILESLLAVSLLGIAVTVIALVVLRYVFNSSITGANEAITILFIYTTAIGAAVAVGKREHIAISFATETLSPRNRRFVDSVGLICVALLNGVMIWYSIGWIRITGDYLMPTTGLPRWVAQLSIPVGCGLVVVYCLLQLMFPVTGQNERPQPVMLPERSGRSRTE